MDRPAQASIKIARDLDELYAAWQPMRRGGGCVACDESQSLSCPKCPAGTTCQYEVPDNCQSCPKSVCAKSASAPAPAKGSGSGAGGSSGPNVGAIAGGVVGGVVFLALLSYLVWRLVVKPNRSKGPESVYQSELQSPQHVEKDNASRLTRRSSTHTVHSIASTVLTRASNIIQIAYIPGVTNRATPTSPDSPSVLVPPVPPIPSQHAQGRQQFGQDEQHFFVPGDLRNSTYSGISSFSDRTSYARTSYAPRSSIASTIYGRQAQVAAPAQTGMRAKPTMVSVRSAASGGSGSPGSTPPVPSIDFEKFNGRPKSGASAFSVGSTFLNNANTATQARAQVINVAGGLKKIEVGSKSDSDTTSPSSTSPPSPTSMGHLNRDSNAITIIDDTPVVDQGPFSDPPERLGTPQMPPTPGGLEVVAEDESEEQDQPTELLRQPAGSTARAHSPFGDEHATKE